MERERGGWKKKSATGGRGEKVYTVERVFPVMLIPFILELKSTQSPTMVPNRATMSPSTSPYAPGRSREPG